MKKLLLLIVTVGCFSGLMTIPQSAEAYWGYREYEPPPGPPAPRYVPRFRPRFAMSLSGGVHFIDTYNDGSFPLTYAVAELGAHLWIHPNLSLDLGLGTHLVTNHVDDPRWGHFSIKPGLRAKFGLFYLRGALDIAISGENSERQRPVLFGFLLGIGLRVPVGHRVRLFGEIDYQFLFADIYYMPFYGKLGVEVVF